MNQTEALKKLNVKQLLETLLLVSDWFRACIAILASDWCFRERL